MLKNSEKESRLYLCCCSHGSASPAYFPSEITTLCLRIPIGCCGNNDESWRGKKKGILGGDMEKKEKNSQSNREKFPE